MKTFAIIITLLSLISCGKSKSSGDTGLVANNCEGKYEFSVGGSEVFSQDLGTINPPIISESRVTVSLKNTGAYLCENMVRVSGPVFSIDGIVSCGNNFFLAPGESCTFDVVMDGNSGTGNVTDTLQVIDLDGNEYYSIPLTGQIL